MQNLINKTTSTVAGVVLFCVGAAMAGLGLAVVAMLAMFALAVTALALLAAPFVSMAQPATDTTVDAEVV